MMIVLLLLLNNVMNFLDSSQATSLILAPFQRPSNGLFGLITSSQKNSKGVFKVELSLFCTFHVENAHGLDPLK